MGAGKTSVGRRVAELSGTSFLDLDDVVVSRTGMTVAEVWFRDGEASFRKAEAAALPEALDLAEVVGLGGGTPVMEANWELIRARACSVFLDAPFDLIWARIGGDAGRPLVARGADYLRDLLEARLGRYRESDFTVDASRDVETVAREVLALWSA